MPRSRRRCLGCLVAGLSGLALVSLGPSFVGVSVRSRRAAVDQIRTTRRLVAASDFEGIEVDSSIEPLADYLLVRPKEAVAETSSGLLLPTANKEQPTEGDVLAIGPGGFDEVTGVQTPMWAEVGARVFYSKYGAEKVTMGGDEHALVRDEDVLLSYSGEEASLDNLKLPRGKVLVELGEKGKESTTDGGIVLSKGSTKPDTTLGKVVAVGGPVLHHTLGETPLDIDVGDTVKFRWGQEVKLEIGKNDYIVVDSSDCLAKWNA